MQQRTRRHIGHCGVFGLIAAVILFVSGVFVGWYVKDISIAYTGAKALGMIGAPSLVLALISMMRPSQSTGEVVNQRQFYPPKQ